MIIRILIPIANLNLVDDKPNNIDLFIFTNKFEIKQQFLKSESFKKQFGEFAIESIKDNVFIVFRGESKEFQLISQCQNIKEIAYVTSRYIDHLIFCLWFVNDNSVYALGTYVELLKPCNEIPSGFIGIDGYYIAGSAYNTNSECEDVAVSLGDIDFDYLDYFFNRTQDFGSQSEETEKELPPVEPGSKVKHGSLGKIPYEIDRMSRALLFLQLVRRASIPFLKISYQMALFECLFTIGTEDSTYQVTRHAALYLGGTLVEINENINFIDEAYNVRSKFFHGDILKKYTPESLINMNRKLEGLTRTILLSVMEEPDLFIYSTSKTQKSRYRAYWQSRSRELGYEYELPSTSKKNNQ